MENPVSDVRRVHRAVVSGCASGLGAAAVRALRRIDAVVTILDRDRAHGEALALEAGAVFIETDVTSEDSVLNAFAESRKAIGQEDVLVHTPGGGGGGSTVARDPHTSEIKRHSFRRFEEIVHLNSSASFLCASVSAAGMMTLPRDENDHRGVIVLTSSIVSVEPIAGMVAYAASKSGVNAMTAAMARDLAPEGIRVNAILPGSFETPLNENLPRSFLEEMTRWTAYPQRLGNASEYASLALEIIRNRYLNATTFRIDGGARPC